MTTKLPTYVPKPMGTIGDEGGRKYLQQELAAASQSIKAIVAEINRINAVLIAHGIT